MKDKAPCRRPGPAGLPTAGLRKLARRKRCASVTRDQIWSDNPSAPVPMRVQMVRSALLWPVMNMPPRVMLRAAAASVAGKAVMCMLTSAWMPTADQARYWFEQEYCIDPESGNLLVWSEAPGHYVVYDYTASTEFQGHVIANDISIYEAGSRVMQIHVDSIQDASGVNPESLRPTRNSWRRAQALLSDPL
jgi:hypothetical protein